MPMHEVLPHVFLGGVCDTTATQLEEHYIQTVLTVMDMDLPDKISGINYHWVKMYDMPRENIKKHFSEFINIISNGIKKGNLLVHCQIGMSRSVTAIVSYMVAVLGLSVEESLKIIRERRPWACPNDGFMDQLHNFQQEISSGKWSVIDASVTAKFHHNLILKRQESDIMSYNSAEALLQGKINERKLLRESDSNVQQDQLSAAGSLFKCKKCRKVIFSGNDLESHHKGQSLAAQCTSYFLDDEVDWLPKDSGTISGKLNCNKCSAKIGNFSWTSTQCSCGTWVAPAFQIHKSRVDKVLLNPEKA